MKWKSPEIIRVYNRVPPCFGYQRWPPAVPVSVEQHLRASCSDGRPCQGGQRANDAGLGLRIRVQCLGLRVQGFCEGQSAEQPPLRWPRNIAFFLYVDGWGGSDSCALCGKMSNAEVVSDEQRNGRSCHVTHGLKIMPTSHG